MNEPDKDRIWAIYEWIMENEISGIIHIAGKNPVSKYDFGWRICNYSEDSRSLTCTILRGSCSRFQQARYPYVDPIIIRCLWIIIG